MKKKLIIVLMVMSLFVMCSFQIVFAVTDTDYTNEANMLNSLGLFNGTNKGYELDRVPSRVESAAMLVRLLGAEEDAKQMNYNHPFTDVPEWANSIVGYMYEKGLTKGIGNNLFGSAQTASARDYTTFMLRTLGYSDNDFDYKESLNFASSKGIIAQDELIGIKEQTFKRNEMVFISYKTLKTNVKGEENLLSEKLVNSGVITAQKALDTGVADFDTLPIRIHNYKIDYYFSKISDPVLENVNISISGSNNTLDFNDKELLAKYTLKTDFEKKESSEYYGEVESLDMLDNGYYIGDNFIIIFYDENDVMSHYVIVPVNAPNGDYNLAVQPASEEIRNLILKYEEEFRQYKAEKIKKLGVIPSSALKMEDGEDGNKYLIIDRNKLPSSMKNFVYYGQGGESGDDIDSCIDRKLYSLYSEIFAHRTDDDPYVDGELIQIRYNGYVNLTIYDENLDAIGINILEIE